MSRVEFCTTGSNRLVVLTPRYAFKVPNVRCWWHAVWGLIDNMQEARVNGRGRWPARATGVAPIAFALPGGLLNVMRRARPLTDAEWALFDAERHCREHGLSAEPKRDSFGVLDGCILAVDYGN